MTRKISKKGRQYRIKNEFQRPFVIDADQLDALMTILEDAEEKHIPADDGADKQVWLDLEDLELRGMPKDAGWNAEVHNRRNGKKQFIRNKHMASGLRKLVEPHASERWEREEQYLEGEA